MRLEERLGGGGERKLRPAVEEKARGLPSCALESKRTAKLCPVKEECRRHLEERLGGGQEERSRAG
mgnify:CR=1 FL=1